MDWPKLHSEIPAALHNSQELLEKAVKAYAIAGDEEAAKYCEYKQALRDAVLARKKEGIPATILIKVAEGDVAEHEKAYLQMKAQKDKLRQWISAYTERNYNLRHLGKDGDNRIRTGA